MPEKGKELALYENWEVPALPSEQDLEEELDGLQLTFERVRVPSGGGMAFELPGEGDEPEIAKSLVGVIVYHHPVNAWWREQYSGENNPPDCSALDGKTGLERESGITFNCKTCPYNQWGSGEGGRGKACKNLRRLYILRQDELFPLLFTLPPTSINNFQRYLSRRLIQKGLKTRDVVTEVTLQKATSSTGIEYSQAQFKLAGVLPEEVRTKMQEYSEVIKAMARGVEISQVDYEAQDENDGNSEIEEVKYTEQDLPF